MMGRRASVATIAAALALGSVIPAAAQFGWIFGDPPRPPSSVPGGRPPPQQQPDYPPPPADYPPPANYPPAPGGPPGRPQGGPPSGGPYDGGVQSRSLPPPSGGPYDGGVQPRSLPPPGGGPYDGGVQSRSLPPPAGGALDPAPRAPIALTPPAAQGPAPRAPRGPIDTSPQPGDEVVAEPPSQRITNKGALFSGLDKITGRIISFDVAIGETVQFGALQVTPRACFTRPSTETQNTDSFIEVDEVTLQGEVRRIFTGWVFAASPGLHAVEHPIYDIWLTDCKSPLVVAEPVAAPSPPPAAQPPRNPQPPAQPKQKQAPKQQQQTQQGLPPIR